METVVNRFASRNYQKVKNEVEVVTITTKGMRKVIYDSAWTDTKMKRAHLKQECFNSNILIRCVCFRTGRQSECQKQFTRKAASEIQHWA